MQNQNIFRIIKIYKVFLFCEPLQQYRKILFFYFICLIGFRTELRGVDFNNTQVSEQILNQSLDWNRIQNRNEILYFPNSEKPHSGFLKKNYPNTQVQILVRLLKGQIDQSSLWKENGIPVYAVEIIPGSMKINEIPDSIDKLDGSKFHGNTRFWYANGQNMLEAEYSFGKRNGITRSWYENGNLKVEENYKDGLKDGNARSWYENGKKWMDYTHWNDKRDGPLTWWYENGEKRQEGNYKSGQRFGEWTYYKDDGSILYRKIFRDGKSISTKYGEKEKDEKK